MAVDIFNIEPNKISRDLKEKIVTIYGVSKGGKTTTASKFPKSLLLAAEKGYNALAGVKAQDIDRWSTFKQVLKQLSKPQAKEVYETIILDTADIFYNMCEKFICQREGVEKIGDIPYGGGYKMVRTEFEDAVRSIPMMGFGIVMISHSQDATFTDEQGREYTKTVPTLPKAARYVVLSMSDIIAFVKPVEVEGKQEMKAFLRGTPRFEAGSRFKYTPPVIDFTYDALVEAIASAIEKEEEENSGSVTNETKNAYAEVPTQSFDEIKAEVDETIATLMKATTEETQPTVAANIKKVIEEHLGKGKMLKDVTDEQRDHLELVLIDLKELSA